jgi:ubiquinone/menaquinone biosynthesis C-methylase UbiE
MDDINKRLNEFENHLREKFLEYTRKAFNFIPNLGNQSIIDIGCGTGIPTIELAKLIKGKIIGIDINQESLNELNGKIEKYGLSDRVKTENCSFLEIDFPEGTFDIIWAEGVTYFISFERALIEWKRFLTSNGYLVLHDEIKNHEKKVDIISKQGYVLKKYFSLPENAWWDQYYHPLEEFLNKVENENLNENSVKIISKKRKEIETYKKNPEDLRSGFYILQKQ